MTVTQKMLGANIDHMPNIAFRMMSFMFFIRDLFAPPDRKLDHFGINSGDIVMDYGCGPGSYVHKTASMVGEKGTVYAVDVHELAIAAVRKKISKFSLGNVKTLVVKDYQCDVSDNSVDLIYALDMFHMVKQPDTFLKELHRMTKKEGRLILEDGHQPREQTKQKIRDSKSWHIAQETKGWLVCTPV